MDVRTARIAPTAMTTGIAAIGSVALLVLMLLKSRDKGVRFEVSGRVPVFIGRHALGLDAIDSKMSRQHAEIWFERGVWLLRDLNSTNGTYVNGNRAVGLVELEVGDRIRCGRTELVIADLRPVERDEDGSWGSDPDDTAMAAGELSGLLDAAQRPGGAVGVMRLGEAAESDADEPAEADEHAVENPADPNADLISLLDEERAPKAKTPANPSPPESEPQADPTPEFPDPEPPVLESAAEDDEYTGDPVIDLPSVPSETFEAETLDAESEESNELIAEDSPQEPPTPDNFVAAEPASPEGAPPDDAPAASADSDGSEPTGAPAADEPVASELPSPDPSDQDDDMLQLGFRGSEEPSRQVEVEDAALRGETPGRFTVEDLDDTLDPTAPPVTHALDPADADDAEAAEAEEAPQPQPAETPETPWAKGERAALLGPPIDESQEALDQGRPETGVRYPGHAGGRGRQKLPMALVGTLVVLFAGGAWIYGAMRQGWISPPSVTGSAGTDAATDAPVTDAAPDLGALPTEQLADARRPRSSSPARISADTRDRAAARSEASARQSQGMTPTPAPGPATTPTPIGAAGTSTAANEFDAFDGNLTLPPTTTEASNASTDTVLASATAPRVGSAEQLQAIIDGANAKREADAPPVASEPATEPARPQAVEDASESFVWSGITIGNDDTVFTADTEPSAAAVAEAAAESPETVTPTPDLTAPAPPVVVRPSVDPAIAGATRRVAFLVDVSGTMVDSMPQLRAHLAKAIDRLEPDTAFTVLLFRQDEAIELPPDGLRLASASARSQAVRWLDNDLQEGAGAVQLGGRSDPTAALQTALGYGVSDLVVLSDNALGKRAKPNGADLGVLDLTDTLDGHADVRLHAVQFNYADERQLLRQLADRFDGNYEFVEEVLDASPDGLEPLTLIEALR
ncbi:MAG: FHA domain-containing protein [Planctomycetota bacterium]